MEDASCRHRAVGIRGSWKYSAIVAGTRREAGVLCREGSWGLCGKRLRCQTKWDQITLVPCLGECNLNFTIWNMWRPWREHREMC